MAQPAPGPEQEVLQPILYEGTAPATRLVLDAGTAVPQIQAVDLVRSKDPPQAYRYNQAVRPRPLSHGRELWGHIYQGYMLPRGPDTSDGQMVFVEPSQPGVSFVEVMIKVLVREIFERDVEQGGAENPYREIFRMQQQEEVYRQRGQVGPHRFLPCIEAICSDQFLFIVTPFMEGGSLHNVGPFNDPPGLASEGRARYYFRQMLLAVQDLHSQGFAHRDVDPGNFLVNGQREVVLSDLAMSFPFPPNGRVWFPRHQTAGKPPYMPREVFGSEVYDVRQADLWACGVSLFAMLTGYHLYMKPVVHDSGYRYAILARGLSHDMANERVLEVIDDVQFGEEYLSLGPKQGMQYAVRETQILSALVPAIMRLSPELRELLGGILHNNPEERWTFDHVWSCSWMNLDLPEGP